MKSQFPSEPLSKIADIRSGFAFKSTDLTTGDGIPVIKIANIQDRKVNRECATKFPNALLNEKLKKFILHDDDILIAMTGAGSVGRIGKMRRVQDTYLINQRVGIVRVDSLISDPEYVYQAISTDECEKELFGLATGAGQPNLSPENIGRLSLPMPLLRTQRKIAAVLSAYDDLIENNMRRILILEEMVRALYREWFVEFRFPGHEVMEMEETALGSIPAAWNAKPIGECVDTLGGGTPATDKPLFWEEGDVVWFSPTDLTAAKAMFVADSAKHITSAGVSGSSTRLFPPYSVMMTSRATIGVVAVNTREACTNQGFIILIPSERLSYLHLYFWLRAQYEKINSLATGATFKEISRGTFRQMLIAVPDVETARIFRETTQPIGAEIEILLGKNANLRQTRDLLLPKLVSGNLDVSQLNVAPCKAKF